MRDNALKCLLGCFCMFLFVVFLVRILSISLPTSPKSVTREELAGFNNAIYILLKNDNKLFHQLIEGNPDKFTLTNDLKKILNSEGLNSVWEHIEDGDGWGQNYNFAILTKNQRVLQQTKNPLFVWSSGKNGINEFGAGDDISGNDELNYLKNIQGMEFIK